MSKVSKEVKIGIAFVIAMFLLYYGISFLKGFNLYSCFRQCCGSNASHSCHYKRISGRIGIFNGIRSGKSESDNNLSKYG